MSPFISETLASILNLCIETGTWPEALKVAEIIAIYKSGAKNKIENYRPISLISNIAKVLKKIIYNRIYQWVTINNILTDK